MNTIAIQGSEYIFEEKTYTINKNMSFKINLVRFEKDNKIIVLALLKSLIININDKEENYREFDKKLKLMNYLQHIENVDLINNISKDVNNKSYYNFDVESGPVITGPDSTNISLNDLLKDNNIINILIN